jgi:hypothetical protein
MNIRRSFTNLFRTREDAELTRRAIAERQEELEEQRQRQERIREQVAQALEEIDRSPSNQSWRYVNANGARIESAQTSGIEPIFSDHIVRTVQNRNHTVYEIDLNKTPDQTVVQPKVDPKNKLRKIFGSKDV